MKPLAEEVDELLWQVDEQDNPMGSVNRKVAHDQKILHREIALLIYDEYYRVLFQKRSIQKRSNPGYWSTSVAGHIRFGHEPLEELIREAGEEVGLVGFDFEYREKKLTVLADEQYYKYWFEVQVPRDYPFALNENEVDEVSFFSPQDLDKALQLNQPFNPVFVDYVRNFWERQK